MKIVHENVAGKSADKALANFDSDITMNINENFTTERKAKTSKFNKNFIVLYCYCG